MTPFVLAIVWMCNVLTFVNAVPLPAVEHNRELDMLQIPVSNGKEIDVLTLGSKEQEVLIAERNKRTIGLLRELFPDITKQIDSIVNRIIAQVIRVAGPDLLRSVLSNRPSSQRPNLAADFDDDDDDSDDNNNNNINKVDNEVNDNNRTAENDNEANTRIQIELPTFSPGSQEELSTTTTVSTYNDNDVSAREAKVSNATTASIVTILPSTSSTSTFTSSITTTTTNSPIYIVPPKTTSSSSIPTLSASSTTTTSPVILSTTVNHSITANPSNNFNDNPTTTISSVLTTSLHNSNNNQPNNNRNDNQVNVNTRDVDESQLVAIINDLNRLLNSTDYFVTMRTDFDASNDNSYTAAALSDLIKDESTTPKITKLLPIN